MALFKSAVMNKLSQVILLTAAMLTCGALVSRAQLLTADTLGGSYDNATGFSSYLKPTSGQAVTQTFTGITSIDTLNIRFGSDQNSLSSPVALQVYFSEWSGNAQTSQLGSGTIALAAPSSWTADGGVYYFNSAIDLSQVAGSLTATSTYAFTVVGSASSYSNNIGIFPGQVSYADGSVYVHNAGNPLTSPADINHSTVDFAFIGNSAAANTTPFAPTPESSTVAVLFAGLFVSGMVLKRVFARRRQPTSAA